MSGLQLPEQGPGGGDGIPSPARVPRKSGGRRARSALEESWDCLASFSQSNMSRMEVHQQQSSPQKVDCEESFDGEFGDLLDSAMQCAPPLPPPAS